MSDDRELIPFYTVFTVVVFGFPVIPVVVLYKCMSVEMMTLWLKLVFCVGVYILSFLMFLVWGAFYKINMDIQMLK